MQKIEKKINVKIITELKPFQKQIEEILNGPVNHKKIIWIYDPIGQSGKTQMAKYLHVKYNCPVVSGGKLSDILNIAYKCRKYIECEKTPIFIYDFCSSKISYNGLEQISDGMVSKAGKCFVFNDPHVIVMSRFLPDMKTLPNYRWIIKEIHNDALVDYIEK